MASERDEDTASLKALRERTRSALRSRIEGVSSLEGPCDPNSLDAFVKREIDRFGGRRVEVEE